MKLNIDYAKNLTLTKDIYSNDNFILLVPEGKTLTGDIIDKLKKHGISKVDVDVSSLNETFASLELDTIHAIVQANFNEIGVLANAYEEIALNIDEINIDMSKYINVKQSELSPLLLTIASLGPALKIAKYYNRNNSKSDQISLREVAIAVMLQDIGYLCSSKPLFMQSIRAAFEEDYNSLLIKYPNLSPDYLENYQKNAHPLYSYYLMKGQHLGDNAELAVLMHNEMYQNATNGLLLTNLKDEQEKNPKAAKIAMILKSVDAYNKLLYSGSKYNQDRPFEIVPKYLEILVSNGTLSPEFVNILKEVIPLYPIGTKVQLSDGTTAQVISYNKNNMLNPEIVDMNGEKIEDLDGVYVSYPLEQISDYKRPKHL